MREQQNVQCYFIDIYSWFHFSWNPYLSLSIHCEAQPKTNLISTRIHQFSIILFWAALSVRSVNLQTTQVTRQIVTKHNTKMLQMNAVWFSLTILFLLLSEQFLHFFSLLNCLRSYKKLDLNIFISLISTCIWVIQVKFDKCNRDVISKLCLLKYTTWMYYSLLGFSEILENFKEFRLICILNF